jgi:phosphatidylinositol 3-kinase
MIIVKSGDDLRQDQFSTALYFIHSNALVIQLITLMDNLLKKENLDLKLTPYRVLATSSKDGLVECITPSRSMASVINDYDHDIQKYFR